MARTSLAVVLAVSLLWWGTVESAGPVVRDGQGRVLGAYNGPVVDAGSNPAIRVVTRTGYIFAIHADGAIATDGTNPARLESMFRLPQGLNLGILWFETADCAGTAYFRFVDVIRWGGFVSGGWAGTQIRYVPKGRIDLDSQSRTFLAQGDGVSCTPLTTPQQSNNTAPALLNDPEVTGVPNEPIPGPIEVVMEGDLDLLLRNGFESPT
jgi:hypothetical protein